MSSEDVVLLSKCDTVVACACGMTLELFRCRNPGWLNKSKNTIARQVCNFVEGSTRTNDDPEPEKVLARLLPAFDILLRISQSEFPPLEEDDSVLAQALDKCFPALLDLYSLIVQYTGFVPEGSPDPTGIYGKRRSRLTDGVDSRNPKTFIAAFNWIFEEMEVMCIKLEEERLAQAAGKTVKPILSEVGRNFREFLRSLEWCKGPKTLELNISKFASFCEPRNQVGRIPKAPKGTTDHSPSQMKKWSELVSRVEDTFRRFGAVTIDTPVFELRETLMGKYGEDTKLIYDLKDQGGEQLALRYDLTVPLCRYMATHNLDKIRRYHIAKVYRRDEPNMAKGRYREFYQCDLDIVGTYPSMMPEAEVFECIYQTIDACGLMGMPFEITYNHRGLLDAMLESCGVEASQTRTVSSSIDKLDKEPWEAVADELINVKKLSSDTVSSIRRLVTIKGPIEEVVKSLQEHPTLWDMEKTQTAINELLLLNQYLSEDTKSKTKFDMSLARGLDYYTGTIYEVRMLEASVGSIAAGGRYDDLIGSVKGSKTKCPAVGFSLGIERLYHLIANESSSSNWTNIVICSTDTLNIEKMKLTASLRSKGIGVTCVLSEAKFGKQLRLATNENPKLVVAVLDDEWGAGAVNVKHLEEKKEETVLVKDLEAYLALHVQ